MSCGSNIFNETTGDNIVYECGNIGTGLGLFSGESVTSTETTFNFKSLVAGSNVNLTSTADEITINNTQTEVNTITNLGGAAGQVLVDVLAGSVRARTITGTLGIDVNTSGDIVTLEDDSIQTLSNSIEYTYRRFLPFDVSSTYNSPSGVLSNTPRPMDPASGITTQTGLSTFTYTPAPRNTEPAIFQYTTTANNLTTKQMMLKLYPNLSYANDQPNPYFLASGTDGLLYQIGPGFERRMVNYDGTLVSLTDIRCIAMDINDHVMFFTTNALPNQVRYYDFATKLNVSVLTVNSVNGWTAVATVADLTYSQDTNTLYVQGDTANSRILAVKIMPYDLYTFGTFRYSCVTPYTPPYTAAGSVNHSMTIVEPGNTIFALTPAIGNTQVSLSTIIGGPATAFLATTIPVASTQPLRLVTSADGAVYAYSPLTNGFYVSGVSASVGNGLNLSRTFVNSYRSFTRTPYGILAP